MADYYPESEGFASGFDNYTPEDFALAQFDTEQASQPSFAIDGTGWDGIGPFVYDPKYDEKNPFDLGLDVPKSEGLPNGLTIDPSVMSTLKEVAKTLGLTKPGSNDYDWAKLLGLGAAGLTAYDTLNRKEVPVKTAQQLASSLPSNTPTGPLASTMLAGNQLSRQASADMPSPIRPGVRGYAEGGEVYGPLSQSAEQTVGLVQGAGGGQDDMIEARLSPGEYVFDAESVSMLGDGDNAAGARKLDELRAAMRAHKRSAPPDEIAPKSEGPLSYMTGGLNG